MTKTWTWLAVSTVEIGGWSYRVQSRRLVRIDHARVGVERIRHPVADDVDKALKDSLQFERFLNYPDTFNFRNLFPCGLVPSGEFDIKLFLLVLLKYVLELENRVERWTKKIFFDISCQESRFGNQYLSRNYPRLFSR